MTNKLLISRELLERYVASVEAHGYGFDGDNEIRAVLDDSETCGPIEIHAGDYAGVKYDGLSIIGMKVDGTLPPVQIECEIRCSFCDATGKEGNPWSGDIQSVDGKLIHRIMACKDHKHLVDALRNGKPAPVNIVMPERMDENSPEFFTGSYINHDCDAERGYAEGWNACLDKVSQAF